MNGVNKVILLGRLGADPELRMTPGGQQVCSLRLATSEVFTREGQREERTEWHRVVLWGRLAELAGKYLKKGRACYLEGKIQTRSWDDQQGQKRYTTEIVANTLQFIDSGERRGNEASEGGYDIGPESFAGGYQGAPQMGNYDIPQTRNLGYGSSAGSHTSPSHQSSSMDDDVPF